MERRLVAVMFTDLVGYTSTVQQNEEAGRVVRALHRSVLEKALAGHGGMLLQYFGDGSLSIFPSTVEAVASAHEIQKAFSTLSEAQLRIGIELGDIAYDDQGAYGSAVNVASRLESLSEPGGILVSSKVWQELRNHPEFDLVPLGEVSLKNVSEPVAVFGVRGEGLRVPNQMGFSARKESSGVSSKEERGTLVIVDGLWERTRAAESLRVSSGKSPIPDLGVLPLVGRNPEMSQLRAWAELARDGRGKTVLLTGDRGVGKSRIASELVEALLEEGWLVVRGQAYSTDLGVPFSLFGDAFGPLFNRLDRSDLSRLTQGGEEEMAAIWPPLSRERHSGWRGGPDDGESRSRLFWTFSQLLTVLGGVRPTLLVLEDVQWADDSSLDLLHFLARQNQRDPVLILCPYCASEPTANGRLKEVIQSLGRMGSTERIRVGPLTRDAVESLVAELFRTPSTVVGPFVQRLFDWTRGNSFFLEGTLRALVETRHLREEQGHWTGWESLEWELPRTIRDALLLRLGQIPEPARSLAELAAVMGRQVSFGALRAVSGQDESEFLPSLRDLTRRGVLLESEAGGEVVFAFSHPLIPETLESEIPLVVSRSLHAKIAGSLEDHYGERADEHVDELAYHYVRAHGEVQHAKAVEYLTAAGRKALARNADSEAVRYLEAALVRHRDQAGIDRGELLESLARGRNGVGDQDGAIELWKQALELAREGPGAERIPDLCRRIGKAHITKGRLESALQAFEGGMKAARRSKDRRSEARLLLAEGVCLQQAGRSPEARSRVETAMDIAMELESPSLVARVNRGLLLIHLWNGELTLVRGMGLQVRAQAEKTEDPLLLFWSEWTLAVTDGLRGDTEGLRQRVKVLEQIADRIRSPSLRLWATELSLEYAYASGAWDHGIGIGEHAVSLGKALNENAILPRIQVWLSLIYLGRGEWGRAKELVDEAWEISGAAGAAAGADLLNVHTVVPAHIGKAAYYTAREDWDRAIDFARTGLEVADRTGYVTWGIHRLLPLLAEACLQSRRMPEAKALAQRLRDSGETLDHDLARAWATAAEGILAWLEGDLETGTVLLRRGAELLEEIPMIFEGTRVRRQLAGRLWDKGDAEGALVELRRAYQVFSELGARKEIEAAVTFFQVMGQDPSVPS